MFGNMKEQQEQMEARLKEIKIKTNIEDGAIIIEANAGREIENISIDTEKLDLSDSEQLEDLLLVAMNKCMAEIKVKEAAETQQMMSALLPGLGNLGDLFK